MTTIPETITVLNIGADLFAGELRAQDVAVTSLEWTPPLDDRQAQSLAMIETLVDAVPPQAAAPRPTAKPVTL